MSWRDVQMESWYTSPRLGSLTVLLHSPSSFAVEWEHQLPPKHRDTFQWRVQWRFDQSWYNSWQLYTSLNAFRNKWIVFIKERMSCTELKDEWKPWETLRVNFVSSQRNQDHILQQSKEAFSTPDLLKLVLFLSIFLLLTNRKVQVIQIHWIKMYSEVCGKMNGSYSSWTLSRITSIICSKSICTTFEPISSNTPAAFCFPQAVVC